MVILSFIFAALSRDVNINFRVYYDTTPPRAITDLVATMYNDGFKLLWTAPADAESYVTKYELRYSTLDYRNDGEFNYAVFLATLSAGAPSIKEEFTGTLPPGYRYFFLIKAFDVANNSSTWVKDLTYNTSNSVYIQVKSSTFTVIDIDNPDVLKSGFIIPQTGSVTIRVPPQTFSEPNKIFVWHLDSVPNEYSPVQEIKFLGYGVELKLEKYLPVFNKEVEVEFSSAPKAKVFYFDENKNFWLPLKTVYVDDKIIAFTNHFTKFGVFQTLQGKSLMDVVVYPNPVYTSKNKYFNFVKLPADSKVEIYTITGELIWEGFEDGTGNLKWHLNNIAGKMVSSGVYLAVISKGSEKRIIKVAVIK